MNIKLLSESERKVVKLYLVALILPALAFLIELALLALPYPQIGRLYFIYDVPERKKGNAPKVKPTGALSFS